MSGETGGVGGVGPRPGESLRDFAMRRLGELAGVSDRNAMAQVAACKAILDATAPAAQAGWSPPKPEPTSRPEAPEEPDDGTWRGH